MQFRVSWGSLIQMDAFLCSHIFLEIKQMLMLLKLFTSHFKISCVLMVLTIMYLRCRSLFKFIELFKGTD